MGRSRTYSLFSSSVSKAIISLRTFKGSSACFEMGATGFSWMFLSLFSVADLGFSFSHGFGWIEALKRWSMVAPASTS